MDLAIVAKYCFTPTLKAYPILSKNDSASVYFTNISVYDFTQYDI